jgi:hypothetical protein
VSDCKCVYRQRIVFPGGIEDSVGRLGDGLRDYGMEECNGMWCRPVGAGRKEQRGVVPPYGIGEADWFTQPDRQVSTLFFIARHCQPTRPVTQMCCYAINGNAKVNKATGAASVK